MAHGKKKAASKAKSKSQGRPNILNIAPTLGFAGAIAGKARASLGKFAAALKPRIKAAKAKPKGKK